LFNFFLFELLGRALKGHDEVKSGGWRNSTKGSGAAASPKTTRTSGSGGSGDRSGADMLEGEAKDGEDDTVARKQIRVVEQLRNLLEGVL
jgi:hypothetical protein